MSRNTRIAIGLLFPFVAASIILVLVYSSIKAMEEIDSRAVLVMLGFIVSSVASGTFTAYFFKDITFKKIVFWNFSLRPDIWLIYLNALPWAVFIYLFSSNYWILAFPLFFTPLLGYWFGKRYFSL